MSLAGAFADLAVKVGAAVGAPFAAGEIVTPGVPVTGPGGSIVSPGVPTTRACRLQVDQATDSMRRSDGYADGDRRLLVLSSGMAGGISTDDTIKITEGPFDGEWMVESVSRDPADIGYEIRGRRA